jgi:hypothetical protein
VFSKLSNYYQCLQRQKKKSTLQNFFENFIKNEKKKRPRENKRGQMAKHGRLDLDQIRLLQRASSSLIKIFLLTFKGNIDNCLII